MTPDATPRTLLAKALHEWHTNDELLCSHDLPGGGAVCEWEAAAILATPSGRALLDRAGEAERLREALDGMARQFAYWADAADEPGLWTGGLSALEYAFDALGWTDPYPMPSMRCDEPGCKRQATCGWPSRPGGTGLNGGYRRTCGDHMRSGYAALQQPTHPEAGG